MEPYPIRTDETPLSDVVDFSVGFGYVCVLLANGGVECWGQNTEGQLGINSFINQPAPVPLSF